MEHMAFSLKSIVALIGTFLAYILGGYDAVLQALIIFVVLDYVTGVIAAGIEGKLNSNVGWVGIAKKLFIFVMVAVAHQIDCLGLFTEPIFRSVVVCFYLANEGLSILENAVQAGVPVPDALKKALESLKEGGKA